MNITQAREALGPEYKTYKKWLEMSRAQALEHFAEVISSLREHTIVLGDCAPEDLLDEIDALIDGRPFDWTIIEQDLSILEEDDEDSDTNDFGSWLYVQQWSQA